MIITMTMMKVMTKMQTRLSEVKQKSRAVLCVILLEFNQAERVAGGKRVGVKE